MRSSTKVFPLLMLFVLLGRGQVNILTANGNNERTNSNLQETVLSPATVNPSSFGKLGVFPVDGQVYSQPLVVSGLSKPGGGTHNVVFVSTMHNSVYAFDADAMSPVSVLWHVNLGSPVPALVLFGEYGDITNEIGILSTGAIDLQRGVLYVVTDTFEGGIPVFYLHALDLATGAERLNGPVALAASVQGSGSEARADGTIPLDSLQHIQRPGLLLANHSVYVSFGSHGDQNPYHGWMLIYDASDVTRQLGVYMTTPDGNAGSIWQSGRGPAADRQGNIYIITANGDYDGVRNFSESFVKVSATGAGTLDWFTPTYWKSMSDNDDDLSAGPALISGTHTMIGADKGGYLYIVNGDAMRQAGSAAIIPASAGSIFNLAVWSSGWDAKVYVQGAGEAPKCFQVTGTEVNPEPLSTALNSVQYSRIGMTISANGGNEDSGILWESTGDYNAGTPGTLHAYDASNLANELWNSDMNSDRDRMTQASKFAPPTVANGKVYVASFDNVVTVYGLFTPAVQTGATPSVGAVAHAASYFADAVAPGEVVAIFGSSFASSTAAGLQLDDSGAVSTALAGVRVWFDGVASPLIFASASQIDAVIPFGLAPGQRQVQVQYGSLASSAFPVTVVPAVSGIFSADASGTGQAIALNQDGSLNSPTVPAVPGSVITIWATGAGELSPAPIDGAIDAGNLTRTVLPVAAEIGGLAADVLYAGGAPGMVEGVIQVNLRIPAASRTGAAVPLVLRIGTSASQVGITLVIQASGGKTPPATR